MLSSCRSRHGYIHVGASSAPALRPLLPRSWRITSRSVCLALPDLHRRLPKSCASSFTPSPVAIFLHELCSSFCIEQRRMAPCNNPSPWTIAPTQYGKEDTLPDPGSPPALLLQIAAFSLPSPTQDDRMLRHPWLSLMFRPSF
ncbi:hypothetical protein ZWY2020_041163 [Hordeum vulgare]|nr:hypothetical protein ZWY2020_041163 [Hordeum vulgare]